MTPHSATHLQEFGNHQDVPVKLWLLDIYILGWLRQSTNDVVAFTLFVECACASDLLTMPD